MTFVRLLLAAALASALAWPLEAQDSASVRASGDSVTVRFVETELRTAVQALSRYLDRPVLIANLPSSRVTIETPRPLARSEVFRFLRSLVESQNLELVEDSAFIRIRPREQPRAPPPPPPAVTSQDEELTVVRLRHARAADVASTLGALYGVGGGDLGGGSTLPGTLSEELRRNVVPPVNRGAAPPQQAPSPQARASRLEGHVTIVPDPFTNALLIRASPADALLLRQAITILDVRPLQVLIEVIIVEARRDRQLSYGLDITLPTTRIGKTDATVDAHQTGGGLGDFVVRIMNLGRADVDMILRAGVSRGDVEILSRPVLLAANNQEARFLVGSQRPFVQVSYSLPNAAATRDQVVQYKDVGTRLMVRPTISADGYVTLDVTQEVSNATNETAFDAPVIATREASTQVLVRDGQTVVLGGLTDRQRDVTQGGVPFLSELPLIGGLFGRYGRHTTETELFLFLTPRVLRTDTEVDSTTAGYLERSPESVRRVIPPPEPRP